MKTLSQFDRSLARRHQSMKRFDEPIDVSLVIVDVRADAHPTKPRRHVDILGLRLSINPSGIPSRKPRLRMWGALTRASGTSAVPLRNLSDNRAVRVAS